jgi:hypothetical protein
MAAESGSYYCQDAGCGFARLQTFFIFAFILSLVPRLLVWVVFADLDSWSDRHGDARAPCSQGSPCFPFGGRLPFSFWISSKKFNRGTAEGEKEMSPITIGVMGIGVVLLLMAFGLPIGFAMILVGSAGFAYLVNLPAALQIVGVSSYGIVSNYEWLVLHLFFFLASISSTEDWAEHVQDCIHLLGTPARRSGNGYHRGHFHFFRHQRVEHRRSGDDRYHRLTRNEKI